MARNKTGSPSCTDVEPRNGRSQAFQWLKRHHRRVRKVCEQTRYPWLRLVREMHADGVVNLKGEPPDSDVVRKTWRFVLRNMELEAARRAAKAAERQRRAQPPPSRPSPGYSAVPRPTSALVFPDESARVLPTATGSPSPVKPYDPTTATPEEVLARVKAGLRRQDSRYPTFKERATKYVEPIPPKR